ncbi:hypothetical protein DUI87_04024 [Hirundo rustica rustica]|uniref:ribonuclease H n=1 Tax=Hirundo rustica rustica TaxID=333673 RepID=A0A3M0L629_HIRRU|nr:hypothetical protein DUI87_04024 [Hirundo rustica rustica]
MMSSAVQTTPPPGRRDSSTSCSHAPPSGSHGRGPEGAGPESESSQFHWPSPIPSLAPVVYKYSRGGHQVRPVYHPFPQSAIKDLCKAHKDYGRESPYFRGLLRSDLNVAAVTPADLRQLFSCLMNSTEFQLWESAWRRLLSDALPSLLVDPETAVDEEGNALTLDHLMGEGCWTAPVDQVNTIPPKALDVVRDHAMTAFFGMAPDGPVTSYNSKYSPYRLRLTEGLHLRTADWVLASVNTEEQGPWPIEEGEFMVIGDCKHTPLEIEVLPGTLVNNPGRLVLWLRCAHPPTYLAKGQIIAQMIPTRGSKAPPETPIVCPVQAITEERPRVASADKAIIHHYMDDVLVCAPNDDVLSHALDLTITALIAAGFKLQEEKVQRMPPWRYLGLEIS